jgi:SSS family solute:Na+ symporter
MNLRVIDITIVLAYLAGVTAMGLRFSRKQTSTETYFVAKRSIPSWAMGMSLFSTLISSVTFVAYPGSAYASDWSNLVPGFLVLGVLALVGAVVIPFYRHAVGMSAYEYFGKRFGQPTRMYSSFAFSLAHFSKMGFVFYLLALTLSSMTGWSTDVVIVVVGAVTIFYSMMGGLEAVIWTDVVQGCIMWVGVSICLGFLLFLPPGGPSAVIGMAMENHKFSLGNPAFDLSNRTIPVLILYGFFWYLQKYTADQTVVQRYLVAKSDRSALKGVAFGAALCVPIWTIFMLIGSCAWSFYRLTGEKLPAHISKADQVFPYFLSTHIPPGLMGLFLASLLAAAMGMTASDLNALAVVGVEDYYRVFKSQTTDQQRLRLGKIIVIAAGALCIVVAEWLSHASGGALSNWFSISAAVAGGLAGLFLLAFCSTRANRQGVYAGIVVTVLFTIWASLTNGAKPTVNMAPYNYPWHDLTIGAVGHVVMLIVGYVASLPFAREEAQSGLAQMTLWRWLRHRHEDVHVEKAWL